MCLNNQAKQLVQKPNLCFRPYSNKFYKHHEKGTYHCKICGQALFLSKTKYEAGTGWPSFYDVIQKESVVYRPDASGGKSMKSSHSIGALGWPYGDLDFSLETYQVRTQFEDFIEGVP